MAYRIPVFHVLPLLSLGVRMGAYDRDDDGIFSPNSGRSHWLFGQSASSLGGGKRLMHADLGLL